MTHAPDTGDDSQPSPQVNPPHPAGLMIIVLGLIGLGAGVAGIVGLGPSSILAGLTALVLAFACFGGSLRADLLLLARFAPLMVVATSVPRLLAPDHPWIAIGVVVLFVLLAAPAAYRRPALPRTGHGRRPGNDTVVRDGAQGVGQRATDRAGGGRRRGRHPRDPIRRGDRGPVVPGAHPGRRGADDRRPQIGPAYTTWLRDRPVRWIGEVITAGPAYHMARSTI